MSPATPNTGGPVFIIGSQGSGSTLLRLMLDSHEAIAIPQETGFMRLVQAHRWVPFWRLGNRWHQRLGLSDEALDARLRDFYGGLFADYAASRGKRRWGDKTPFHVWHVDQMASLFPDAVFIGIVRHPFGVVASIMRRFDRGLPRAIRHWCASNTQLLNTGSALAERFAMVRYEDLARSPEQTMRELLEWLGEPWSENVLRHHEIQPRQGAPKVVEGRTRTNQPVDPSRTERWRQWLREEDRASVAAETGPLLDFLGYERHSTTPVRPNAEDGATLLSGVELARRRAAARDVDFTPPEPPRADQPLRRRRRPGGRTTDVSATAPPAEVALRIIERMPAPVLRWWRSLRSR